MWGSGPWANSWRLKLKSPIKKFLAKTVFALSAFFWAGCSDDAGSNVSKDVSLQGAKVDVDEALASLGAPDTTGLRGQTVSAQEYYNAACERYSNRDALDKAAGFINAQKDKFLKSSVAANVSQQQKSCLEDASVLTMFVAMYGVPFYTNTEDKVIDQTYIDAVVKNHNDFVDDVKYALDNYNKHVDECDENGEISNPE